MKIATEKVRIILGLPRNPKISDEELDSVVQLPTDSDREAA